MKETTKTSLLLIVPLLLLLAIVIIQAENCIGKPITKKQMAGMFGGLQWCNPDRDCDTITTGCPGGDSCPTSSGGGSEMHACYGCLSNHNKVCGEEQSSWGWLCVDSSVSCNDFTEPGACTWGLCEESESPEVDDAPFECGSLSRCN